MISTGFWRSYWVTSRPYLCFVSGASGLVGLALASTVSRSVLVIAFAAFFVAYGLGQALTDVFQMDTDSISAPYRPLVRGEISRRDVLFVSSLGLAACGAAFFLIDRATLLLSGLGVIGLATYTPLKRRWWAGPLWNSGIVALLPLMGALCGEHSLARVVADPRALAGAASVFFSYGVFVILGYFKDVEADRATGYVTLPVRFGRRASVWVSSLFLVAALASSATLTLLVRPHFTLQSCLGAALVALGVTWLVLAHSTMLGTCSDDEAHAPIALSVRGFVALHLGQAALIRGDLALPALALLLLFELALAHRPCERQI